MELSQLKSCLKAKNGAELPLLFFEQEAATPAQNHPL